MSPSISLPGSWRNECRGTAQATSECPCVYPKDSLALIWKIIDGIDGLLIEECQASQFKLHAAHEHVLLCSNRPLAN